MNRLNPLNNYFFQKIMGEKGSEQELLSFLNSVLERTGKGNVVSIDILENEALKAEKIVNMGNIVHIKAKMKDNKSANIEIQIGNTGVMDTSSIINWSKEFSDGIKEGENNSEAPNLILINIVNVGIMPVNDFHATFHLCENDNPDNMLTDALEIHFIDITKFRLVQNKDLENNTLHRWITFLDQKTEASVLEKVVAMDSDIQNMHSKIEALSNNNDALRMYEICELALLDIMAAKKESQ